MVMVGADVEQLRKNAAGIAAGGRRLESIERDLTGRLNSTAWVSDAGDRFRGEWNRAHRASLDRAAAALKAASDELIAQAEQQERASEDGVGSSGPACGRPPHKREGPPSWLGRGLSVIDRLADVGDAVHEVGKRANKWLDKKFAGAEGVIKDLRDSRQIKFIARNWDNLGKIPGGIGAAIDVVSAAGIIKDMSVALSHGDAVGVVAGVVELEGMVLQDIAIPVGGALSVAATPWIGVPVGALIYGTGTWMEEDSQDIATWLIENDALWLLAPQPLRSPVTEPVWDRLIEGIVR